MIPWLFGGAPTVSGKLVFLGDPWLAGFGSLAILLALGLAFFPSPRGRLLELGFNEQDTSVKPLRKIYHSCYSNS